MEQEVGAKNFFPSLSQSFSHLNEKLWIRQQIYDILPGKMVGTDEIKGESN